MTLHSPRRVVITGLGLISPLGISPDKMWEALRAGQSGIATLQSLPVENMPSKVGGEARDFTGEIENFGPLEKMMQRNIKKGLKMMCREIQMGVAAAQLALHHAGMDASKRDPERTGVSYGSDYVVTMPEDFADGVRNCLDANKKFDFTQWAERGLTDVDPLWLLKYLPNMPGSHIAIYNDLRGPSNSITLREAAANLAVGEAFAIISRGGADAMIAGATGTRIHPLRSVHTITQEQVAPANELAPEKVCRPFDRQRTGQVLGEGAGAVLLEELQTAQTRGATIWGEVVGNASSCVVDSNGVADYRTAIRNVLVGALRSARIAPEDVGHIHAHGLSTHRCDAEEAQAIHDIFGQRKIPVPVTAAKSYFGNLGAGGGTVELIASLLSLRHGQLFPVLNFETPDPECPINIARSIDQSPGESFVNINTTPRGQASAVVVRRFDG